MPTVAKKGCSSCCGTCNTITSSTQCQYHQGSIMAGCSKPPNSCAFNPTIQCDGFRNQAVDDSNTLTDFPSATGCVAALIDSMVPFSDLCQPIEKNGNLPFTDGNGLGFLYENWIDTCSLTWYALVRSNITCGLPIGYQPVIQASNFRELDNALFGTHNATAISNIPAVTAGNSFVFSYDLPVPSITASWRASGRGETLTPPYVLTGSQYGYQVFVRDSRNNRYYRDSYNSHCTQPQFPCNPCNQDCFVQELIVTNGTVDNTDDDTVINISYEFISEYCVWYLADPCDGSAVLPTENTAECELACCWNRCGKRTGPNPKCLNAENRSKCVEKKPTKSNCGCK